jgi:hypothetical protein
MTEERTHASPELDPKLEEWLRDARDADGDEAPDLGPMLAEVEKEIASAEKRPRFWLQTRPTWVRRAIAFAAAAAVVGIGGLTLRPDLAVRPPAFVAVAIGSLAILLALSLHQALRPLHRPPMPRGTRVGVVALTIGATLLLALLSPEDPADVGRGRGMLELVSPCLFIGLGLGVPVYLVLRLLDRGAGLGALLASCAAGLAGNLALQLHCPNDAPEHLMLAHFSVALLFVAGLGAVHALVRHPGR